MSITIQQLNELKKNNSKRKSKKRIVQLLPKSIKPLERDYLRDLLPIIQFAKETALKTLLPVIDKISHEIKSSKKRDSKRQDDWIDELDSSFKIMRNIFGIRYSEEQIKKIAQKQAEKVNYQNKKSLNDSIEKVYGIRPIGLELWQIKEMKAFVRENVSLIKSMPDTTFSEVEKIVMRSVQNGELTEDIASKISDRFDVSESRAALIARDQTNKFNGSLSEIRQKDLGIESYVWRTSMDSRVRPEHQDRNNQVFKWDELPPDEIPGQPINCRCIALAVLSDGEE